MFIWTCLVGFRVTATFSKGFAFIILRSLLSFVNYFYESTLSALMPFVTQPRIRDYNVYPITLLVYVYKNCLFRLQIDLNELTINLFTEILLNVTLIGLTIFNLDQFQKTWFWRISAMFAVLDRYYFSFNICANLLSQERFVFISLHHYLKRKELIIGHHLMYYRPL